MDNLRDVALNLLVKTKANKRNIVDVAKHKNNPPN